MLLFNLNTCFSFASSRRLKIIIKKEDKYYETLEKKEIIKIIRMLYLYISRTKKKKKNEKRQRQSE